MILVFQIGGTISFGPPIKYFHLLVIQFCEMLFLVLGVKRH